MASSVGNQCLCLSTGTGTGTGGGRGGVYRTDVQGTLSCTAEHIYTRMYFYKPLTSNYFMHIRIVQSFMLQPQRGYIHTIRNMIL